MGQVADVLAHPFRLAGSAAATVDDDSEAGAAQELIMLTTTRPGERGMVPDYGVPDPAFTTGMDVGVVNTAVAEYGPPGVNVTDITQGPPDDLGRADATLTFEIDPEDDAA